MSKSLAPTPYVPLVAVLRSFPLRYIAEHTDIGKNRLHRLRSFPADIRLFELQRLADARFLRLRIDNPYGTARRKDT